MQKQIYFDENSKILTDYIKENASCKSDSEAIRLSIYFFGRHLQSLSKKQKSEFLKDVKFKFDNQTIFL